MKTSASWYEKAGKAGDAQSQHNAGIFYYKGRELMLVPAAYEWF